MTAADLPRQTLYLHICGWCRCQTRDPAWGVWSGKPVVESTGICPACLAERYPEEEVA